jgi:HlyD family type I secretion membrane fusion protein
MSLIASTPAFTPLSSATDNPRRELIMGGALIAVFFVGGLTWASFTRLDAAASAQGVVVVSGHRQKVQPKQGGVVSALHVKEGDQVKAGQVLVEIASAEARANERSLSSRVIHTEAEIARLQAERAGVGVLTPPPEFAALTGDDKIDAERAVKAEQSELTAQRRADQMRHAVYGQAIVESGQQILGFKRQIEANEAQQALIQDELKGVQELAAQGYAPVSRVRALQRSAVSLKGESGSQNSEIARLTAQGGQSRLQIAQGDSERATEVADTLRKAEADLQSLNAELRAARDQLESSFIRSPATGPVVGLTANTVGGVVATGQTLMEIVPQKADLVVEARIAAHDAESLHAGQAVQVHFDALHLRNLPNIKGVMTLVSADALTDERTGQSYFTATVKVPPSEMAKVARARGDSDLKPGLPVRIVAPLHKRTALQYWLEPMTTALRGSFEEH